MAPVLECRGLRHEFRAGAAAEAVLRGIDLALRPGETCLLMGPSGSGKTTLLSILGCLLTPTAGELLFAGRAVRGSAGRLAELRRTTIGFVFQHAQLLPFLTVVENLVTVGRNAGLRGAALRRRVADLLDRLDLAACERKRPHHLSGGQRQRVAVARAILHRPPVILADEPTAALDWGHGEEAVRLLVGQAREEGAMLLTVTHDTRLIPYFGRRLAIDRGRLTEDLS